MRSLDKINRRIKISVINGPRSSDEETWQEKSLTSRKASICYRPEARERAFAKVKNGSNAWHIEAVELQACSPMLHQ